MKGEKKIRGRGGGGGKGKKLIKKRRLFYFGMENLNYFFFLTMGATFKGISFHFFFFTKEENKEGKNGGEGKKIRWMGET